MTAIVLCHYIPFKSVTVEYLTGGGCIAICLGGEFSSRNIFNVILISEAVSEFNLKLKIYHNV